MQLFILFIVGAVILGSGAMLSPAWPTREPRIGLAATFFLALIVGGAVWWAELFGWSTLVIDYLLFALVSFVVLGGTLSSAQARAEAKGEEVIADSDQGWPGPEDLAFFAVAALLCCAPLLVMQLPAGTAAQATGLLALTARDGGSFTQLGPYYPDIEVLAAPGFQALTAYLSQQLDQPTPFVQWSVAAVVAFLCVWMAYDLGGELRDKRLGRALALGMIGSLSIAGFFINGFYGELFGLLFGMAFLLCILRVQREGLWLDSLAAGLLLGAVLFVSPAYFVVLSLSTILWLLWNGVGALPSEQAGGAGVVWIGVLVAFLFGTGPWVLNNTEWLLYQSPTPILPDLANLSLLLTHFGSWLLPVAILGAVVAWRSGETWARQALVWALLAFLIALDLGAVGLLATLLPTLTHFLDPARILWLGAAVPMLLLASYGSLWLYERLSATLRRNLRQSAYGLMGLSALGILAGALAAPTLLADPLNTAGPAADDIATMRWLAENAPEDAVILNHPQEGLWAAALAERPVVHLPTLRRLNMADADTPVFDEWQNIQVSELQAANVTYVLVPEGSATPWIELPVGIEPVDDAPAGLYRVRQP